MAAPGQPRLPVPVSCTQAGCSSALTAREEKTGRSQREGRQTTKFYCLVGRFCHNHPPLNGEAHPTSYYIIPTSSYNVKYII
jgi:hypothetical protein